MPDPDASSPTNAPLAYRQALERRDLDGLLNAVTPDVLLRSPITQSFSFAGREQFRSLYSAVFQAISEFHVSEEIAGAADVRVLRVEGTVGGVSFQELQLLRLDEQGRVSELTLFFRPLPALPALAHSLAGPLIAARSPMRARLLKLLIGPLVLMTRVGDRIVTRLLGGIPGMVSTTPPS
ncbi:MAG TPA: nuclear transport factor 2 family protein [Solirubrobacteraceae bacterium]